MKKLALTLCISLCSMISQAANEKSLFVTFMDGNKVEFALSDFPEVTFGNDMMNVNTSKTNVSYELWTVKTFTYATTTRIKQLTSSKPYSINGNHLIVDGTTNHIECYKANGEAIDLPSYTTSDKTLINIDHLKQGVYLIKLNGIVIKIARQ